MTEERLYDALPSLQGILGNGGSEFVADLGKCAVDIGSQSAHAGCCGEGNQSYYQSVFN
jgi:hypothetical protein